MTDEPLDIVGICERISALPRDEQEVLVNVLEGMERGLEVYGALSIDHDSRNWDDEMYQEIRDSLAYVAIRMIQKRRRG